MLKSQVSTFVLYTSLSCLHCHNHQSI